MIIDVIFNDLIPIEHVPKLLPGNPGISTIHRWRTRGVRGVKLASVRLGGRRLIPRAALVEFIESLTSVVDCVAHPGAIRTSRRRSIEVAEREVDGRLISSPRRGIDCHSQSRVLPMANAKSGKKQP